VSKFLTAHRHKLGHLDSVPNRLKQLKVGKPKRKSGGSCAHLDFRFGG